MQKYPKGSAEYNQSQQLAAESEQFYNSTRQAALSAGCATTLPPHPILPAAHNFALGTEFVVDAQIDVGEVATAALPPGATDKGVVVFNGGSSGSNLLVTALLAQNGAYPNLIDKISHCPQYARVHSGGDPQLCRLKNGDILATRQVALTAPVLPQPGWWNDPGLLVSGQQTGERVGLALWRSHDRGASWGAAPQSILDSARVAMPYQNASGATAIEVGRCAWPQLSVPKDQQAGWRWCRNCHQLFFSGDATQGACPATLGGPHDPSQSGCYVPTLGTDAAARQGGWRWCGKCQALFQSVSSGPTACPAGGQHDGSGSGNYAASLGDGDAGQQSGWRSCRKCRTFFFSAGPNQGVCPAGASHDASQSGHYAAIQAGDADSQQGGWSWCRNCQALFYAGGATQGVCPANSGKAHDASLSGKYAMTTGDDAPARQGGWRWCNKCQAMFFSNGKDAGVCPADKGLHASPSGGDYAMLIADDGSRRQGGWRWCAKCQSLFFAAGASLGPCAAGGQHDAAQGGHYAVAYENYATGGWDRDDIFVDHFAATPEGNLYVTVSSDSGTAAKFIDHVTMKSILFLSQDGGRTWLSDNDGHPKPIQVFDRAQPLAMTTNADGWFWAFHCVGDVPTLYASRDGGLTVQAWSVYWQDGSANRWKAYGATVDSLPGKLRDAWTWGVSRAADGVRIVYPSQKSPTDPAQVAVVIFARFETPAKKPTVSNVALIEAANPGEHVLYATFIETDRVDLPASNRSDVTMLYWVETEGNNVRTRYCMFYDSGVSTRPANLSTSAWPVSGEFDIGDYMKGAFYFDGKLNFLAQWPQKRNDTGDTINTIRYRIVTVD